MEAAASVTMQMRRLATIEVSVFCPGRRHAPRGSCRDPRIPMEMVNLRPASRTRSFLIGASSRPSNQPCWRPRFEEEQKNTSGPLWPKVRKSVVR